MVSEGWSHLVCWCRTGLLVSEGWSHLVCWGLFLPTQAHAVVVATLLKPHVSSQPADMVPFFQISYVREHANNIFEAYAKLLAEMVLAIPIQFKKWSDAVKWLPDFGQQWLDSLCEVCFGGGGGGGWD